MRACIVCHKFIKQPQYCPKHEPKEFAIEEFLQAGLGTIAQQQTTQMQNDLRAQQFGGLGDSSLQDALARGALGQYHPGQMIPVDELTPIASGPFSPNMRWVKPALSWVLNPITTLGLRLRILKRRDK